MNSVTPDALSRLNRKLREENEALREQIAYLQAALMGPEELPLEWGLTKTEQRIVRVCLTRDIATKEAIATALYWDKDEPEDAISNIRVHLSKIRRKLKPFGIEIKTSWGNGFYVPSGIRERFQSRRNERKAAA